VTAAPDTAAGRANAAARPAWVSIEGVNGVGKTHLAAEAARILGPALLPLIELPDSHPERLPGQVIAALRGGGDLFLRTGHPRTETLLLSALLVHRHENTDPPPGVEVVLEDRGVDSVAAYQAAILTEDDEHAHTLARQILHTMAMWRPLPDATVLLRDDPAACLRRFRHRIGRPASRDEQRLMARVDGLYTRLAAEEPHRFTLIDRRHTDEQAAVEAIITACLRAATAKGAPCVL